MCIYVHTHARMCASVVKHLNILFAWTLPLTVALSSHIGNRSKIVTISGKGVATGFSTFVSIVPSMTLVFLSAPVLPCITQSCIARLVLTCDTAFYGV